MAVERVLHMEDSAEKPDKRKRKTMSSLSEDDHIPIPARLYKRIVLSLTKPSYLLSLGGGRHIRHEIRQKLALLLRKLVRRHNWSDASGVLSVLLEGTCLDRFAPGLSRLKYSVSMELLKHIEDDVINLRKVKNIYWIWFGRMGRTRSSVRIEDKVALHLDYILLNLTCDTNGELHQAALSLMKEHELVSHPFSNMVMGLSFCELWYANLSRELKLKDSDEVYTCSESNDTRARFGNQIEYSACNYATYTQEAINSFQYDSETSVMNGKIISMVTREVPAQIVSSPQSTVRPQEFRSHELYLNSSENEAPFCDDWNYIFDPSTFTALDCLESWLVPVRLPRTRDEFAHMHQQVLNQHYKDALKYFQLALYSTPPVFAALLPLIQLLLIVGKVTEALRELEKFCNYSNASFPLRIKASLYERLCSNDPALLQTCFEDILKKDPTCCHSLARLVGMHQNGTYSSASLVEAIALHLDATYTESDTWKEFASCFLQLSQYKADRMSGCRNGNEEQKPKYSVGFTNTPKLFIEGASGKAWKLRCRWWLKRHFSKKIIESEIAAGKTELVCYKAACASHMYGKEMEYVGKAYGYLKEQNTGDLLSFLEKHRQNSIGICSSFQLRR